MASELPRAIARSDICTVSIDWRTSSPQPPVGREGGQASPARSAIRERGTRRRESPEVRAEVHHAHHHQRHPGDS